MDHSVVTRYIVVDTGCIECGEDTSVLGVKVPTVSLVKGENSEMLTCQNCGALYRVGLGWDYVYCSEGCYDQAEPVRPINPTEGEQR